MPQTTPLNILMVDDHVLLRDALATLINNFEGFHVSGLAADGVELMHLMEIQAAPDIVLLDINMPNMDGFETTHWLSKHYPEVKVLILSMFDSEITMIRLLQDGVRGFLKKDIHPSELRAALVAVAEEGFYYSGSTTNKLAALFRKDGLSGSKLEKVMLTDTEIKFLRLASSDKTYKEVAVEMNLTLRVIDNYREALFAKLDVKSRVGLVMYAIKHGVVSF